MPAAELAPEANGRVGAGRGTGTIEGALVLAYRNNPQFNAQRSATRATDENVPTALAGYRPRVTGTSSLTDQYLDTLIKEDHRRGAALYNQTQGAVAVSSFGLTTTQTLFNGFQTASSSWPLLYSQDAYILLIASANGTQVKSEASATSAGMLARPIFSGLLVAP
jgi:outer membrane protein TolC